MKVTIKFEASIPIKDTEKIVGIKVPDHISNQTNVYDAYAEGYCRAFNDIAQELINTFSYGANGINAVITKLNDKNRNSLDEQ